MTGAAQPQAPAGRRAAPSATEWRWNGVDVRTDRNGAPSGRGNVHALIFAGGLSFEVQFSHIGAGAWWRAWGPTPETVRALGSVYSKGTGLFPAIDGALREITAEFLAKAKPASIDVVGADGKRNRHNAATYGSLAPDGYRFEVEADDEGVPRKVRFVANEPAPAFIPGRDAPDRFAAPLVQVGPVGEDVVSAIAGLLRGWREIEVSSRAAETADPVPAAGIACG